MSVDSITVSNDQSNVDASTMSYGESLARKGVFALLKRLNQGTIVINQGPGTYEFGSGQPRVTVTVHDPSAYFTFLLGGEIGAGRAYMEGRWDVGDLIDLVRIFVRNRSILREEKPLFAWVLQPIHRLIHRFRKNTIDNSRDNIRAHYDLGNEFFRTFLDETMNYSCAVFSDDDESLAAASRRKMEMMCEKLQLTQDDHVLEIGTGWGSLAIHAARNYGCEVTTTTLSDKQYTHAKKRVDERNLNDQVTVLNRDYREIDGTFDKLVSVEMIEAVGHEYFDTFFEVCKNRLKPGGRMALQAITIRNHLYESYRRSSDFIRHFIFPGGCLPSLDVITSSLGRVTDFSVRDVDSFGQHYVRTLRIWKDKFRQNRHRVEDLGYPESFQRMWEFYLNYCEGGFLEGIIDNHQIVLSREDVSGQGTVE